MVRSMTIAVPFISCCPCSQSSVMVKKVRALNEKADEIQLALNSLGKASRPPCLPASRHSRFAII